MLKEIKIVGLNKLRFVNPENENGFVIPKVRSSVNEKGFIIPKIKPVYMAANTCDATFAVFRLTILFSFFGLTNLRNNETF